MRRVVAAVALLAAAVAPARADCTAPAALIALGAPLPHCAAQLADGRGLTIVAFGSSSTAGKGASTPAMNYPSRLEAALRERFPGTAIRVVNRGVGGRDIDEEIGRIDREVLAEHPDLVIWQLGTNAVLRRANLAVEAPLIARAIAAIRGHGIDLVLMDLQYAPRVLDRASHDAMERLIERAARDNGVGLFRRFAIMRRWAERGQLAPAALVGPDGLHMTDASYGCLADDLAEALAWTWWPQVEQAMAARRPRPAIAGIDPVRAAGDGAAR